MRNALDSRGLSRQMPLLPMPLGKILSEYMPAFTSARGAL